MGFVEERKRAGFSQSQVAKALGVDQTAVSMWETGKNFPTIKRLKLLTELYGCTLDDLLEEPENENTARN